MILPAGRATDSIVGKDVGSIVKTSFVHSNTSWYKFFCVWAFYHNSWHKAPPFMDYYEYIARYTE
jgi:hypothetical protein